MKDDDFQWTAFKIATDPFVGSLYFFKNLFWIN